MKKKKVNIKAKMDHTKQKIHDSKLATKTRETKERIHNSKAATKARATKKKVANSKVAKIAYKPIEAAKIGAKFIEISIVAR
jgi:hypothetical protein